MFRFRILNTIAVYVAIVIITIFLDDDTRPPSSLIDRRVRRTGTREASSGGMFRMGKPIRE